MSNRKVYKWSLIDRIGNTVITFAGNIILARMLTPADFGLLAMVGIFTAIAYNISSCGMSDGLIHKLNPTDNDYSTVFVFNSAFGLLFGLLFIVLARPISEFFDQPPLVDIMIVIGICFVCQTMYFVQETRLRKQLEMKKIAIVKIAASLCAVSLGIWLAYIGASYWGLVMSRIVVSVFILLFYIAATRWFPRIAFSRQSFREMFSYGINLMLAYICTQFGRNINSFVLGKYSPGASGVYSQAQKMEEVPYGIFESALTSSFFAVVSNEPDRTKRHTITNEMLQFIILINLSLALIMLLLSDPGFNLLFGAKWAEAIPVFRILCMFGIAVSLRQFFVTVMKADGKTRQIRNLTVGETVLQLALLALAFRHGIMAIALTQVTAAAIILLLYLHYYIRIERTTIMSTLSSVAPALAAPMAAFAITAIGYWFWHPAVSDLTDCILTTVVYTAMFVAMCRIMPQQVYRTTFRMLTSKLTRRK